MKKTASSATSYESKASGIKALFEPKSIAVVGASRRKEAVGFAVLNNLIAGNYKGKIYPVNPKADNILGINCYPSINDINEPIDLAILVIPSKDIIETLETCGQKKVKSVVIITAGFREIGSEGSKLEQKAIEISHKYNMPILGPNCLGFINTDSQISVNASFARTMAHPGKIAFLSQSGALCAAILDYARGEGIGFSKFVSMGNKADINELDILKYLRDDPQTEVILIYVEDLVDGHAFIETAREITGELAKTKPILAIKAGRTPQGSKAASSHTGSLMGSDEVYDAIFEQAGVIRMDSVDELFNLAIAFAYQPIPKGNRVAIVTNAGGPGIMATDAVVRSGLDMATLSAATVAELKPKLPATASTANPIDIIGDAQHDRYEAAMKSVLKDDGVDSMLVILTPQAMTDIEDVAKEVVKIAKETSKTLLTCFMGYVDIAAGVKILDENKLPHYKFPEEAARALSGMCKYRNWVARPRTAEKKFNVDLKRTKQIIDEAKKDGQRLLRIDQALEIFKAYGFPVLPYAVATTEQQAVAAAEKMGFPVVLKIVSSKIVHKTDVGGVALNLTTPDQVAAAYSRIQSNIASQFSDYALEGILVQPMSRKGREVILGMNQDPHFGPIVMFGLGGTYVEVLKDVTFRLAPIRELGAERMIESIKMYAILKGVRGESPADIDAIKDCLERLSQLACDHPEIGEIDLNPLIVLNQGQGAIVVDARMVLA